MRPEARIAAAIEILDTYLDGATAEQALSGWARRSRFAGSKDRAAIRDHVFDAIRNRASFAALGGGLTGRGLLIGLHRASERDLSEVFTGQGHAPTPVTEDEMPRDMTLAESLDCPDWLFELFQTDLGQDASAILTALKKRAPVCLRVNLAKSTRDKVIVALREDAIIGEPSALVDTAIMVAQNARKIASSAAYTQGLIELQDVGSQWISDQVPAPKSGTVLDMCAGGGGKALAIAGRKSCRVLCSDINPRRMKTIPERALRAGLERFVSVSETIGPAERFDTIVCDVPCSGSGSWRRDPEGKWNLTPERLTELVSMQADILDRAASHLNVGGHIAYMTCSLLRRENHDQVSEFLRRHPAFRLTQQRQLTPLDGSDGFFVAILNKG